MNQLYMNMPLVSNFVCVCQSFIIIIFICVSDSFNLYSAKNKGGLSEDIHAMNMMMAVAVLNMRG